MFPVTDKSQTIIDCFMQSAKAGGVELHKQIGIQGISALARGGFELNFTDGGLVQADIVCVACGSLKASSLTRALEGMGHHIEPLAPSVFAVNVNDSRIQGLLGMAVPQARVRLTAGGTGQTGPLLVTHRGFSGPAMIGSLSSTACWPQPHWNMISASPHAISVIFLTKWQW